MACKSGLALGEWVHIVHTYEKSDSRIYVNGVLDGQSKTPNAPLDIKSAARLYLGGWYSNTITDTHILKAEAEPPHLELNFHG